MLLSVTGYMLLVAARITLMHNLIRAHSLSISKVETALDTILREYRNGVREPSVLSHALLHSKSVDKEAVLDQVTADLEDQNVHPDSIHLNKSFH
jgi:hypothetical protein